MKSGLECLKLLDVVIDFVDLCSDINPNVSNNAEIREIRRLIEVTLCFIRSLLLLLTLRKSEWGRKSANETKHNTIKLKHELVVTAGSLCLLCLKQPDEFTVHYYKSQQATPHTKGVCDRAFESTLKSTLTELSTQQRLWFWFLFPSLLCKLSSHRIRAESDETSGVYSSRRSGSVHHNTQQTVFVLIEHPLVVEIT